MTIPGCIDSWQVQASAPASRNQGYTADLSLPDRTSRRSSILCLPILRISLGYMPMRVRSPRVLKDIVALVPRIGDDKIRSRIRSAKKHTVHGGEAEASRLRKPIKDNNAKRFANDVKGFICGESGPRKMSDHISSCDP